MRRKLIIKISIVVVSLSLTILCFSGCSFSEVFDNLIYKLDKTLSCEVYMFESISELENMENSFKEENGSIKKYASSYDECLKDLEYNYQYSARYKCDDYEFEIFAYEFETIEEAQRYYCYSKNSDGIIGTVKSSYENSTGKVTIVALNRTNIYRVKYLKRNEEAIEEFFSKNLTHQITWLEDGDADHECIKNDKYKG